MGEGGSQGRGGEREGGMSDDCSDLHPHPGERRERNTGRENVHSLAVLHLLNNKQQYEGF